MSACRSLIRRRLGILFCDCRGRWIKDCDLNQQSSLVCNGSFSTLTKYELRRKVQTIYAKAWVAKYWNLNLMILMIRLMPSALNFPHCQFFTSKTTLIRSKDSDLSCVIVDLNVKAKLAMKHNSGLKFWHERILISKVKYSGFWLRGLVTFVCW